MAAMSTAEGKTPDGPTPPRVGEDRPEFTPPREADPQQLAAAIAGAANTPPRGGTALWWERLREEVSRTLQVAALAPAEWRTRFLTSWRDWLHGTVFVLEHGAARASASEAQLQSVERVLTLLRDVVCGPGVAVVDPQSPPPSMAGEESALQAWSRALFVAINVRSAHARWMLTFVFGLVCARAPHAAPGLGLGFVGGAGLEFPQPPADDGGTGGEVLAPAGSSRGCTDPPPWPPRHDAGRPVPWDARLVESCLHVCRGDEDGGHGLLQCALRVLAHMLDRTPELVRPFVAAGGFRVVATAVVNTCRKCKDSPTEMVLSPPRTRRSSESNGSGGLGTADLTPASATAPKETSPGFSSWFSLRASRPAAVRTTSGPTSLPTPSGPPRLSSVALTALSCLSLAAGAAGAVGDVEPPPHSSGNTSFLHLPSWPGGAKTRRHTGLTAIPQELQRDLWEVLTHIVKSCLPPSDERKRVGRSPSGPVATSVGARRNSSPPSSPSAADVENVANRTLACISAIVGLNTAFGEACVYGGVLETLAARTRRASSNLPLPQVVASMHCIARALRRMTNSLAPGIPSTALDLLAKGFGACIEQLCKTRQRVNRDGADVLHLALTGLIEVIGWSLDIGYEDWLNLVPTLRDDTVAAYFLCPIGATQSKAHAVLVHLGHSPDNPAVRAAFITEILQPLPTVHGKKRARPEPCTVCLEDSEEGWVFLPCFHAFHKSCISAWLCSGGETCPTCKASIVEALRGRDLAVTVTPPK